MKTWDPLQDEEARARFVRNIEALSRHDPDLAAKLEDASRPVSRVIETETGRNLDIGHTMFYDTDVADYVDKQYEEFAADPYRIDLGWPGSEFVAPRVITRFAIQNMKAALVEKGLGPTSRDKERDVTGFAVILGVGIGDHIGRVIEDNEAQSLIVVEQFQDFLWYSLHLNPWDEWIESIEARNGRVFIIMSENAPSATTELVNALRSDHGGTLDGTLIYTHYRSNLVREINKGLMSQISYVGSNRGFFEDENIMILNATRNFIASDFRMWQSRPRREKLCPAFVVAAGPSIDESIDVIKANKDKAIIISCGSGLKVLLAYGVKPDFHCEVENTFGQADILERVASQHDLSGITLVAASTVNPRTAAVFEKHIFFHRDSVCSTLFFEVARPIMNAVPTVANCGVRFALGMAFREIYLFGIDLGKRIEALHHSKVSGYYTDEEFMFSFQGTEESVSFPFSGDGNFGGTVQTSDGFLMSRLFLEKAIKGYRGHTVYNCSDGIEVPHSVPKLPSSVRVSATQEDRDHSIDLMHREFMDFSKGELTPPYRFHDLRDAVETWYAEFQDRIQEMKAEPLTPFEIFGRIEEQFGGKDRSTPDPEIALLRQSTYGTVFSTFNIFFRFYRRIEAGHEAVLQEIFLEELRLMLEDLEAILLGVVDELIGDIEAALDSEAAE